MNSLRKLWWGSYPLPTAFWGFYVFGGFVVLVITAVLGALLLLKLPQLRPVIFIMGLCISWSYWAIASIGTWRSADAYKGYDRLWPVAAKIVVGLFALGFLFRFINGGALVVMSGLMGN